MNYYSGGLAELISRPSPLTFSFFSDWFTGAKSVGKAMNLLGLPVVKTPHQILTLIEGELLVDLAAEEQTLYAKTIFSYAQQHTENAEPKLAINLTKLFNPIKVASTFSLLGAQTSWLVNPEKLVVKAQDMVKNIPSQINLTTIAEADSFLADSVWPVVIAVGALAEYFHKAEEKTLQKNPDLLAAIDAQVAKHDWFFQSLSDIGKLHGHEMTLKDYLSKYGFRADNDYELALPRWQEFPDKFLAKLPAKAFPTKEKPASNAVNFPPNLEALISLQQLRSEARKRALESLAQLRQLILKEVSSADIANLTRDELLFGKKSTLRSEKADRPKVQTQNIDLGAGLPVSTGQVRAPVHHFDSTTTTVPENSIGIFANATPEFTMLFPQCVGLIFLKGGLTSHGAIVAREFKIPAIVDPKARDLPDGASIDLNGGQGTWKISKA